MMVQRLVLVLLVMIVGFGCGGDKSGKSKDAGSKVTKDSLKKITWDKDGAEMVLIPESFTRTKDTYDEFGDLVSGKVVEVLDTFYMDTTEVTIGQFKKFLKSSGYKREEPINWKYVYEYSPTSDYPMIYVTWHDASAYAKWAGKRLPTEAEWEFAARGSLVGKRYSWGNDEGQARDYANFKSTGGKDQWGETTAPVGSLKPNGYGLYDMTGNVWEWCADWYDNPNVANRTERVLRGGSWNLNANSLRVALRGGDGHPPTDANDNLGFRCVSGFPAAQQ